MVQYGVGCAGIEERLFSNIFKDQTKFKETSDSSSLQDMKVGRGLQASKYLISCCFSKKQHTDPQKVSQTEDFKHQETQAGMFLCKILEQLTFAFSKTMVF